MTYYIKGLVTGVTFYKTERLSDFKLQVKIAKHNEKSISEPMLVMNNKGFIMKLDEYYNMIRNENRRV